MMVHNNTMVQTNGGEHQLRFVTGCGK